ncbi:RNA-binding protein [Microcella sp.]|uniref:RNA-binding protein n=1 Tax=Microcella sp. TaxID=1913979 RepID=UPI00391CBECA
MLADTLEHLVKGIVDHPDDVVVASQNSGRGGRTAKALRQVISSLADGRRVRVDVVDTDA